MRPTEDTYRHKGLRKKLTDVVRGKGITNEDVLNAINTIPRHFFLDSAFDELAYEDRAFPIGEGQTISQPYTVAYQSQLLELKKFDKVLEIGTGSAYQAVVLAEPCPVQQLPGFADGDVSVQDAAAQRAASLLLGQGTGALAAGARVLDACAAPGGKTAHLLERADADVLALLGEQREEVRHFREDAVEQAAEDGRAVFFAHGVPTVKRWTRA